MTFLSSTVYSHQTIQNAIKIGKTPSKPSIIRLRMWRQTRPSAVTGEAWRASEELMKPYPSCVARAPARRQRSFHISVSQGKGVFHRQAAVADFDPAPQLDAFWSDVLKPLPCDSAPGLWLQGGL